MRTFIGYTYEFADNKFNTITGGRISTFRSVKYTLEVIKKNIPSWFDGYDFILEPCTYESVDDILKYHPDGEEWPSIMFNIFTEKDVLSSIVGCVTIRSVCLVDSDDD